MRLHEGGARLIPPTVLKIEGPFGGVDPLLVLLVAGVTAGVIVLTTVVAVQLARVQPRGPRPAPIQKASGEFDAWTERPKDQAGKESEYYSLYGSRPGLPGAGVNPRAPPPPPPPTSVAALSQVVVDLGGTGQPRDEGWVTVGDKRQGAAVPLAPPAGPALHPPERLKAAGPSDEVVAPSHSRRIRDTATGDFPAPGGVGPSFERSSVVPGAVSQSRPPGDEAYSPKATAPPPLPSAAPSAPGLDPQQAAQRAAQQAAEVAQALPEGTPVRKAAKTAFRGPSRGQTVVGAGTTGTQEGAVLSPEKKAIRCPKCQTVFAGPAARPATVKCPACGTTGTLK